MVSIVEAGRIGPNVEADTPLRRRDMQPEALNCASEEKGEETKGIKEKRGVDRSSATPIPKRKQNS